MFMLQPQFLLHSFDNLITAETTTVRQWNKQHMSSKVLHKANLPAALGC